MKKNLLKFLALFMMSIFSSNIMAETETNPADATKDTDMLGVSYTVSGTYIAGKGGAMAGTMTDKGIKFRINKAYGETKNALPFAVNPGYKITAISCDGQINDNTKTSTLSSVYVDGTAIDFTPVTLTNKSGSAQFSVSNINATKDVVFVFDGAASQANIQYTVTYASLITPNNADLSSVMIDGKVFDEFDAQKDTFSIPLPYGTTIVPTITVTTVAPNATVAITPAPTINDSTYIKVTAEDGVTAKLYVVTFDVAAVLSDDATLANLSVAGNAINGFKPDSLNYAVEIAYLAEVSVVAEPNFSEAKAVVTLPETLPGKATVVVTAQDGTTTQTYTIDITRRAPQLYQAIFDNGFDAFITDSNTVEVYYAGTKPNFLKASGIEGEGATTTFNEDVITVGGINGNVEYIVNYHEINPLTTECTVVFDSTETYIASVYGWTADKGWRFSKSVEETTNRRVSSGKNRVQFFFGPAYKVDFTWAVERAIKVYVNGIETTTTAIENGFSVRLDMTQNNLVTVVSDQTKGDGGMSGLTLTTTAPAPEVKITTELKTDTDEEGNPLSYVDFGTIEYGQTATITLSFEAKNLPAKAITRDFETGEETEVDNYITCMFMTGYADHFFDIQLSDGGQSEDGFMGTIYTFPIAEDGSAQGTLTLTLKSDFGVDPFDDLGIMEGELTALDMLMVADRSYQNRSELVYVAAILTRPATNLENATIENNKAYKVIENGVVYIIKDGVKYTVTGVAVK